MQSGPKRVYTKLNKCIILDEFAKIVRLLKPAFYIPFVLTFDSLSVLSLYQVSERCESMAKMS